MWYEFCKIGEIGNEDCLVKTINDKSVAVFLLCDNYYAILDNCTHQNLPLADGEIDDGKIYCPYHGASFCIKSGKPHDPPACTPLQTYEVKVEDSVVFVKLSA